MHLLNPLAPHTIHRILVPGFWPRNQEPALEQTNRKPQPKAIPIITQETSINSRNPKPKNPEQKDSNPIPEPNLQQSSKYWGKQGGQNGREKKNTVSGKSTGASLLSTTPRRSMRCQIRGWANGRGSRNSGHGRGCKWRGGGCETELAGEGRGEETDKIPAHLGSVSVRLLPFLSLFLSHILMQQMCYT